MYERLCKPGKTMYFAGEIYVPNWIIWIAGAVLSLLGYTFYKQSMFKRLGIRGPKPTPFFGHLSNFTKEGFFQFDKRLMAEYGMIYGTFYGNYPSLVINDTEMICEICVKQFSKFYDRAEPVSISERWKLSLNNARGTYWKFLRLVIGPTFSSGKIKNMQPILDRCLSDFVEVLEKRIENSNDNVIDMYPVFTALTMDVICSTSFGIEVSSQRNPDDAFVKHASKVLSSSLYNPLLLLNFMFPDFGKLIMFIGRDHVDKQAMAFLTETVKCAIKERRKNDSNTFHDLLKLMMETQKMDMNADERLTFEEFKSRGLTDDEIIMNGIIFLSAGFDTTSCVLTWVTYCLATNPEYQDRLYKEIEREVGADGTNAAYEQVMKMEYLDMFLSETLRIYPTAVRFNREASCDVRIKGLKIPKGMDITFTTAGLHRNPAYWPDPDTFDPERFSVENKPKIVPYSYMPFGAGPRNCVGMKLALAEVKLTIVKLMQFARLEKSPKLHVPPKMTTGNIVKPDGGLWVTLVKR